MSHRTALVAAALALLSGNALAQTLARNAKFFFTPYKLESGRETLTQADTLYMMPDRDFRYGTATVTALEVVLQDEEQATSEYVQIGIVRSTGAETPDTSASGLVMSMGVNLFGVNQGRAAYSYTITLQTPLQVPEDAGMRLILPQPRSGMQDMCTVQYRPGNRLAMAPKAPARTYAHYWNGTALSAWSSARSTIRLGMLFDEPVILTEVTTAQAAYGSPQTIVGPESVHVDVSRGDRIAWRIVAGQYRPGTNTVSYALPFFGIAPSAPLPTPWGTLQLDVGLLFFLPLVTLDNEGKGTTVQYPLPKGFQLRAQALLIEQDKEKEPNTLRMQLTDGTGFRTF